MGLLGERANILALQENVLIELKIHRREKEEWPEWNSKENQPTCKPDNHLHRKSALTIICINNNNKIKPNN